MRFVCSIAVWLVACAGPAGGAGADGPDVDGRVVVGPDAPVAAGSDAPVAAGPDAAVSTGPDTAPTSPCGDCPLGYHCGTANEIPVCRDDDTGIPLFGHVFVIVMENLSLDTLVDPDNAQDASFLRGLMTSDAWASDYHGVSHPSLANYIAMTSGDTQDIGCDCTPAGDGSCNALVCNIVLSSCSCPREAQHLGDQLEETGRNWRSYAEDMGAPCNLTSSGSYAAKHVPFLYYRDVQGDADRCAAHVVDWSAFVADSANHQLPAFSFLTPNAVHDMHDPVFGDESQNIRHGDDWLRTTGVPGVVDLDEYKRGGLLVVVWDEDDHSGIFDGDQPIPFFIVSPYARKGYQGTAHIDHYNLLATIEDGLGLPRLGQAASAPALSDFFPDR
jgi:hypothetical protein